MTTSIVRMVCGAIVVGLLACAMAVSRPCAAAGGGVASIPARPDQGFVVCRSTGGITGRNFSVEAIQGPEGSLLLVPWIGNGSTLLVLAADGHAMRALEADVFTGNVTGAVRVADGGVLVLAEEGIFRWDGQDRLSRIVDCERIGPATLITQPDGRLFTLAGGSLLLHGAAVELRPGSPWPQGRLWRLLPSGRVDALQVPPLNSIQDFPGDALLVSNAFGHFLVSSDGRTAVVATGAIGSSGVRRGPSVAGRRSETGIDRLFAVPSYGLPATRDWVIVVVDPSGRTRRAMPPADVRALSRSFELDDGRVFWLSDQGLLRLGESDTLELVSHVVRLACADQVDGEHADAWTRALPDGRTLVHVQGSLFTVDRAGRVVAIARPGKCPVVATDKDNVAVAADGTIYFAREETVHRAARNAETVALVSATETGPIFRVERRGRHVIVQAREGHFLLRAEGRLQPLAPIGAKGAVVSCLGDELPHLDEEPLVCVDGNSLHRLDGDGNLRAVSGAATVRCDRWAERIGALGVILSTGDNGHVLVTHDDRLVPMPSGRLAWAASLADGSQVFMALDCREASCERATPLTPAEQAAIPRSFIRVAPDGGKGLVAFEGPPPASGRGVGPTWAERIDIRAVHFTNATRGYAIFGERGIVATTDDGGATWRGIGADGEGVAGAASMSFTGDGRRGIIIGQRVAWATDDAGATWNRTPLQDQIVEIGEVWLLDPDGARAYAITGWKREPHATTELVRSDDGGRTWVPQVLPLPAQPEGVFHLHSLGFDRSGTRGWVVARNRLLATRDRGETWHEIGDLRDYRQLERAGSLSERQGVYWGQLRFAYWKVGEHGCLARGQLFCIIPGEGGAEREIHLDADVFVKGIAVANDGHRGWAVGSRGTILATADGGRNWAAQPSGTAATLDGVFFLPDGLHGWVWGEGRFLKTDDGGASWHAVEATRVAPGGGSR